MRGKREHLLLLYETSARNKNSYLFPSPQTLLPFQYEYICRKYETIRPRRHKQRERQRETRQRDKRAREIQQKNKKKFLFHFCILFAFLVCRLESYTSYHIRTTAAEILSSTHNSALSTRYIKAVYEARRQQQTACTHTPSATFQGCKASYCEPATVVHSNSDHILVGIRSAAVFLHL